MKPHALALTLAVACLVHPPPAAQQLVFRTGADAVLVDVSVRDGNRPVLGLVAGDFELTDNKVGQTVRLAMREDSAPLDVTVVIDTSDSIDPAVLAREAAKLLDVRSFLKIDDRFRVLAFDSVVREVTTAAELTPAPDFERRHTALWQALGTVLLQKTAPDRRRLTLVVTDGMDTISMLPPELLLFLANRSDTVVDLVRVGNQKWAGAQYGGDFGPSDIDRSFSWLLREVVERTGGGYYGIPSTGDSADHLRAAIQEFRSRYLLSYVPAGVPTGGWHELKVQVKKPGRYTVVARKGYQRH
jgi:hypothetical protein